MQRKTAKDNVHGRILPLNLKVVMLQLATFLCFGGDAKTKRKCRSRQLTHQLGTTNIGG